MNIWTPMSPFHRRMTELAGLFPPPPTHPHHEAIIRAAERFADTDIATRLWIREIEEKWPHFLHTRTHGGSGLSMSETLRSYLREYNMRLSNHGFHSLPTSFNILESFFRFSHRYFAFDIREEREHMLRFSDYLDWYTAGRLPEDSRALIDLIPGAIVHQFNMLSPLQDFRVETDHSSLALLGLALVRHSTEVSALCLLGEHPPFPPDENIDDDYLTGSTPTKGKEGLKPDPKLKTTDRYLRELPAHCRVIALARFDLYNKKYNVRHVAVDVGSSFAVVTDDTDIFPDEMSAKERDQIIAASEEGLQRYRAIFATIGTLLYLPGFFLDEPDKLETTRFATSLGANRNSTKTRKSIEVLGRDEVPLKREVRCRLTAPKEVALQTLQIVPPEMEFQRSGYWKTLAPTEIGQDRDGNPMVGRTWVERTDSWSRASLETFAASRMDRSPTGPDPGTIYISRSDSNYVDLYKVGLTRRSADVRARELSSVTGVPTPLAVLATWETSDVAQVEKEIHSKLDRFRVNKRREFFRAPLPVIIGIINEVLTRAPATGNS